MWFLCKYYFYKQILIHIMNIWTKIGNLCLRVCQPGGVFSSLVKKCGSLNWFQWLWTIPSAWRGCWKLVHFIEVAVCGAKCVWFDKYASWFSWLAVKVSKPKAITRAECMGGGWCPEAVGLGLRMTSCSPRGKSGLCSSPPHGGKVADSRNHT